MMQWIFLVFGCVCLLILGDTDRAANEVLKFALYLLSLFFLTCYGVFLGLDIASESDVIQNLEQVGIVQVDTNRLENLTKTDYETLSDITKKFVDEMQNEMKGE